MLPGVYSVDERKYTILSTVVVRKSGTVEGEMPMEKKLFCDVLVIGGGVAGMRAAVAAQHSGASVVLAVKGNIGACGASAYTVTELPMADCVRRTARTDIMRILYRPAGGCVMRKWYGRLWKMHRGR